MDLGLVRKPAMRPLIIRVPDDLRARLKAAAAIEGVTMAEVIRAAMRVAADSILNSREQASTK